MSYSAAAEIIICLIFAEQKRSAILVGLGGLQLTLIALKLDGIITSPWSTVFLVFIITACALLFASLVLTIYGFALRLKQGRFTADIIGVLYQAVFQLSICLFLANIVCRVAFLQTSIYIGAPCIAYHIFAILRFMYPFRQDIAIYKAAGEIVSIMGRQARIDKIEQPTLLYMLSSQWFTLSPNNPRISSACAGKSQCVVCLSEAANLVWMPCGHLTMCDSCGQYMIEHDKLDCVMCKAAAKQIYHLEENRGDQGGQQVGEQGACRSDYHYEIKVI